MQDEQQPSLSTVEQPPPLEPLATTHVPTATDETVERVLTSLLQLAINPADNTAFSWIWKTEASAILNAAKAINFAFPEKPTRDWARTAIKNWSQNPKYNPITEAQRILQLHKNHPRYEFYSALISSHSDKPNATEDKQAEKHSDDMAPVQIKLKPFTYNGSTPPQDYFVEYERTATANQWGEPEKLKYLPAYLEGRAKDHYTFLEKSNNTDREQWTTLKQNIITRFTNPNEQNINRQKLGKMTQRPSQTAIDYIAHIREAAAQLDPTPTEADVLAIAQRGLLPHIKKQLAIIDIKTLAELESQLKILEANLYWARDESNDTAGIIRRLEALEIEKRGTRQFQPKDTYYERRITQNARASYVPRRIRFRSPTNTRMIHYQPRGRITQTATSSRGGLMNQPHRDDRDLQRRQLWARREEAHEGQEYTMTRAGGGLDERRQIHDGNKRLRQHWKPKNGSKPRFPSSGRQ